MQVKRKLEWLCEQQTSEQGWYQGPSHKDSRAFTRNNAECECSYGELQPAASRHRDRKEKEIRESRRRLQQFSVPDGESAGAQALNTMGPHGPNGRLQSTPPANGRSVRRASNLKCSRSCPKYLVFLKKGRQPFFFHYQLPSIITTSCPTNSTKRGPAEPAWGAPVVHSGHFEADAQGTS